MSSYEFRNFQVPTFNRPQDDGKAELRKLIADLPYLMMQMQQMNQQNYNRQETRSWQIEDREYNNKVNQLSALQSEKRNKIKEYENLIGEAKNLGYTSSKPVDAKNKTSGAGDILSMTSEDIEKRTTSIKDEIGSINTGIQNVTQEIALIKRGMLESKDYETNLMPGLQDEELANLKNKYDANSPYLPGNQGLEQWQKDALTFGRSIANENTMTRLQSKAERRSVTNIVPLSKGVKVNMGDDAHYLSPSYLMGKTIKEKYQYLDASSLHNIVREPLMTYTDQAPNQFDYSDVENLLEVSKRDALELAKINAKALGLSQADLTAAEDYYAGEDGSKLTPKYIQFERNFQHNVKLGLTDNKNYRFRDQAAIQQAESAELSGLSLKNQDILEAYKNAPTQLNSILIDTSDEDDPEYRVSPNDIVKALKKKGMSVPKSDVEAILSTLATSSAIGLPTLMGNPNVKAILQVIPGGDEFLNEYLNTILPSKVHVMMGSYTPQVKAGSNEVDALNSLIDDL